MSTTAPDYFFEPLSMLDYGMLGVEDPTHPMHTAALTVFEGGGLLREDGGVDHETLRDAFLGVLHHVPRYRQKLMWQDPAQAALEHSSPGLLDRLAQQPPVWVDDADFDLDYHVRHLSVPRPGTDAQLQPIVSHLIELPLDRTRPLWEAWLIEGLEGGRFAVLLKIHHCMVDGMAGVGLAEHLLSLDPDEGPRAPEPHEPRPAPTVADLRREDLTHKVRAGLGVVGSVGDGLLHPGDFVENAGQAVRSLASLVSSNTGRMTDTPLNGTLGQHRRFEWCRTPLAEVKAIKNAMGCTVNDALLLIVTDAIRQYLDHHEVDLGDDPFRIGMPVDLRAEGDDSAGNQITLVLVELPLAESRLDRQLEAIRAQTGTVDREGQTMVVNAVMSLVEFVPMAMQTMARSFAGPGNCYLTNLRGPDVPLYQVGSELVSCFPIAPLTGTMGLCVGAMTYLDEVCWGLLCDPEVVPDVTYLRQLLEESVARTLRRSTHATVTDG